MGDNANTKKNHVTENMATANANVHICILRNTIEKTLKKSKCEWNEKAEEEAMKEKCVEESAHRIF